jgi:hypothetical protein
VESELSPSKRELVPVRSNPVRIHGADYSWLVRENELQVFNGAGGRLDPTAARVIVALGGTEPSWYSVAYALVTAHEGFSERELEGVNACAAALALADAERAQLARTVVDQEVLRALGAYGDIYVGVNPSCDQTSWALVVNHRDPEVMRRAYETLEVLSPTLATFPDDETKLRVARNLLCSPETLIGLATEATMVRQAVAANPHTPEDILEYLSREESWIVRRSVAANPHCPDSRLKFLLRDRQALVRVAVVNNGAVSWRRITAFVMSDPTPAVHAAAASRFDLSIRQMKLLERYSRSDPLNNYKLVCSLLSANPLCPDSLRRNIRQKLDRIAKNTEGGNQRVTSAQSQLGQGPRLWVVRDLLMVTVCLFMTIASFILAVALFVEHSYTPAVIWLNLGFAFTLGDVLLYRRRYFQRSLRVGSPRRQGYGLQRLVTVGILISIELVHASHVAAASVFAATMVAAGFFASARKRRSQKAK